MYDSNMIFEWLLLEEAEFTDVLTLSLIIANSAAPRDPAMDPRKSMGWMVEEIW